MKLFFGHRALVYELVHMSTDRQGKPIFKKMWRFTTIIKEIPGHCTNYRLTSPYIKAKRLA